MTSIGLRELRQHASHWVDRAAAGETIEITKRGRPIAVLTPRPTGSVYERLVASGDITVPTSEGPLTDIEPLPSWDGPSPSDVLQVLRDSERF